MEREYDVVARVTTYVNGNAEKSMILNNPLIYTVNDKIVMVKKEGDINQTALSICASHNSKAFSKELNVLRSLVNMEILDLSKKPKRGVMYKKNLEALGMDDFEGYLGKNPEGYPVLYMEISIHASKAADKRSKSLASVSFRILTEHPDSRTTKARTDWFVLKPAELPDEELTGDDSVPFTPDTVSENKDTCTCDKPQKPQPVNPYIALYSTVASAFMDLDKRANEWLGDMHFGLIKDVVVFARSVDVIGGAVGNFEITNRLLSNDPNYKITELENKIINAYGLLKELLYTMENKGMVDHDLFRLTAKTIKSLGLGKLSGEIYAEAMRCYHSRSHK